MMRQLAEELQGESVANSLKRKCKEHNIMRKDGFLDPIALGQAFRDGLLELDEFIDALQWETSHIYLLYSLYVFETKY